jgi:hypothetical protein
MLAVELKQIAENHIKENIKPEIGCLAEEEEHKVLFPLFTIVTSNQLSIPKHM